MSLGKDCCSMPPVQADYTPKGSYSDIQGYKTYTVGPADATAAIIYVFDIFKFAPQSIQGADLLASSGIKVIVPDFFKGEELDASWFGPNAPADAGAKIGAAFGSFAAPGAATAAIKDVFVPFLKAAGAKKVGAAGFCWGAAVVVGAADGETLSSISMVHPSMLQADSGDKISIPTCLLPSKGEDKEIMASISASLEKKPFASENVYKVFSESQHGFAAARCDLSKAEDAKNYEEAYKLQHTFFKKTLA